jgi:lipoprotein-anchoring transpeptidase ErfK/SrfK
MAAPPAPVSVDAVPAVVPVQAHVHARCRPPALLAAAALLLARLLTAPGSGLAAAELDQQFQAAQADPAQVVPLIQAASARIITLPVPAALALAERLAPYSARVYLSAEHLPGMEQLGVELIDRTAGSTHWGTARHYGIGMEAMAWLDPDERAHQVKVIDAKSRPLTLAIARGACRLAIWHGATLVTVFPVAVGTPDHPTPLGSTSIALRVQDPEWRDPVSGHIYGPHDPGNFLGGYWMGFAPGDGEAFRGIGVHGWTAEEQGQWLSKRSSHGCLRMAQQDLKVVYGLAVPGVQVVVRE